MRIQFEIDEKELRVLVHDHFVRMGFGEELVSAEDVVIEVKTSKNFKAEWEPGQFRAKVNKLIP